MMLMNGGNGGFDELFSGMFDTDDNLEDTDEDSSGFIDRVKEALSEDSDTEE